MDILKTPLAGVLVIQPKVFGDERGFFMEMYALPRYREAGIALDFVQDNLSFSRQGVLRGLHFQKPDPQGKLVQVLQGKVYDVAVDIRKGSPTFGQWHAVTLDSDSKQQFYVPPGMAHGFCVLSETALFTYKCTAGYNPAADHTLAFDDPDLGIPWPMKDPQLSAKDQKGMRLRDLPPEALVDYREPS